MINPKFAKRFSLPFIRPNKFAVANKDPWCYYFKNSSQDFKDEIADIYVGSVFKYDYNGEAKYFGDAMGIVATESEINQLLDIQEKYGIQTSLTLNHSSPPPEIVGDRETRLGFIKYLKKFYDSGIRMCTMSNMHLMASGILQENFPDMHWKSTINNLCRSTQEVYDFAAFGFNTVLIDRSLNRNLDELKRIKEAATILGIQTSLLANELCIPNCPFKREHDLYQPDFQTVGAPINDKKVHYWASFGKLSCGNWRHEFTGEVIPRLNTSLFASDRETLDAYLDCVDVIKFAGRLNSIQQLSTITHECALIWQTTLRSKSRKPLLNYGSFSEIYENNDLCLHTWNPTLGDIHTTTPQLQAELNDTVNSTLWATEEGKAFNKVLQNCRSICYKCNLCDKIYGFSERSTMVNNTGKKRVLDEFDKI